MKYAIEFNFSFMFLIRSTVMGKWGEKIYKTEKCKISQIQIIYLDCLVLKNLFLFVFSL